MFHAAIGDEGLAFLARLVDLVTSSDSQEQLCQRMVHDDITQGLVRGAHLYAVDSNLDMELAVSHGQTSALVEKSVSAWEESPLSKSLLKKHLHFQLCEAGSHLALPFARSSVPNGAMLLVMSPEVIQSPISESVSRLFSQVGGLFIEVKPRHSPAARVRTKGQSFDSSQLTARQIGILQLIHAGLTNGQIGKQFALSESTIRQETIRIYKTLDVSGRSEAITVARKMGLVPKL
jgi:ATP/maltotriose-dependent transcriptional regulator MalT